MISQAASQICLVGKYMASDIALNVTHTGNVSDIMKI